MWVNADRVNETPPMASSVSKHDYTGEQVLGMIPFGEEYPAHGRGVAVTSKGIIWYSVLQDIGTFLPEYVGDGRIHKTDTVGSVLPDIPDPGGFHGPGIGALDATRKLLWAIDAVPGLAPHTVYGLDPANNGAVVASCLVSNTASATVAFAVSGKTFLTDEGTGSQLFQFLLPTTVSSSGCTAVGSFTLPFRTTGIDIAKGGRLPAADENGIVHDLGGPPYATSLGAFDFPAPGAQDLSAISR